LSFVSLWLPSFPFGRLCFTFVAFVSLLFHFRFTLVAFISLLLRWLQELYLLQYHTMAERKARLSSDEISWMFAGLRKCVMDLQKCGPARAAQILHAMEAMTTMEVYAVLQDW
jgi:hypothetical protein